MRIFEIFESDDSEWMATVQVDYAFTSPDYGGDTTREQLKIPKLSAQLENQFEALATELGFEFSGGGGGFGGRDLSFTSGGELSDLYTRAQKLADSISQRFDSMEATMQKIGLESGLLERSVYASYTNLDSDDTFDSDEIVQFLD